MAFATFAQSKLGAMLFPRLMGTPARPSLSVGDTFDRYRIEERLGAGGMGEVYRAYDQKLQRPVAIKLLTPDPEAGATPERTHARLLQEARAAARLRHPNTVAIYDVSESSGIAFITMELVEGKPLAAFVDDDTVSLERRLGWLTQIARALDAAHRAGFVHCDIKPDNIVVDADDNVKLLDFGIAKRASDAPASARSGSAPLDELSPKTATGRVRGTPNYMSPEQWYGLPLDGRSDQFCWGIVAWELISGAHPNMSGWSSRNDEPVPDLATAVPNAPIGVVSVVMRALSRASHQRFDNMEQVASGLDAVLRSSGSLPQPTASRRDSAPNRPNSAATTAPQVIKKLGANTPDTDPTVREEGEPQSTRLEPVKNRRTRAAVTLVALSACAGLVWGATRWFRSPPTTASTPSVSELSNATNAPPTPRPTASSPVVPAPSTSVSVPAPTTAKSPAGPRAFDPKVAKAAVDAQVLRSIPKCRGWASATFGGRVWFAPDGRATSAELRDVKPMDPSTLTRHCMQSALGRVHIPAFVGPATYLAVTIHVPGEKPAAPDGG